MKLFRDPQFERNTAVEGSISSTLKYEEAGFAKTLINLYDLQQPINLYKKKS